MTDQKIYIFSDDSYYDNPGCSCCESTLVEAFNCPDVSYHHGTAGAVYECYYQVIVDQFPDLTDDEVDMFRTMSTMNLLMVLYYMNIKVAVEYAD